jgi:hypothetical protein
LTERLLIGRAENAAFLSYAHVKEIKAIWNCLAEQFLQLDFVRERDSWSPWDDVGRLKWALLFSREVSFPLLGSIAS